MQTIAHEAEAVPPQNGSVPYEALIAYDPLLSAYDAMILPYFFRYQNPLYDAALRGWLSVSRKSHADGALLRTEVLWISPAAQRNMTQMSFPFEGAVA